jgi:hypothetical protein
LSSFEEKLYKAWKSYAIEKKLFNSHFRLLEIINYEKKSAKISTFSE